MKTTTTLLGGAVLALLAGAAQAEVSVQGSSGTLKFSGYADAGVTGGDGLKDDGYGLISLKVKAETPKEDTLRFGATVSLKMYAQEGDVLVRDNEVWMSGDFGRLAFGDIDSAYDVAMEETGMFVGMDDVHTSHVGYDTHAIADYNGAEVRKLVRFDRDFNPFTVHVSAGRDGADEMVLSLGGTWTKDLGPAEMKLGLGHQSTDGMKLTGVTALAKFDNGLRLGADWSTADYEPGAKEFFEEHVGLGVNYSKDRLSMGVNWGRFDGGDRDGLEGVGVDVNWKLSKSAILSAGWNSDASWADGDQARYGVGVRVVF
ncbi:porin [Cereibacter sphaeroides]|uniref:porin n=1 Tax=Cereibacter sphaeroides TaxID=1063 RepID=UPI001F19AEB8|nr:porin [Cereibacter sphaeroides]MCE6958814.1 porin [Cereibacter sphaeroides]MCE6973312.1 porin [Cereibacter sphaeroides]